MRKDVFTEYDNLWERGKYVVYLEHKTDAYKNNKKKLAKLNKGILYQLIPYNNHPSYGFNLDEGKTIDKDNIDKFWKEIDRNTFFYKEIEHIPTPILNVQIVEKKQNRKR